MEQDLWTTNQFSLEFWTEQQVSRSPLLVADCAHADLVYIPLTVQWAPSKKFEEMHTKINKFENNMHEFLPYLGTKPHFMAVSWTISFTGLHVDHFKRNGIIIIIIEGDGSPGIIEVPYPGHYHHHAGLQLNRFIQQALTAKTMLAYECFDAKHGDIILNVRQELATACAASSSCQHVLPDTWFDGLLGSETSAWIKGFFANASTAWFCPQPQGDTPTRRSTFDCLLAGAIPVFFDEDSVNRFPWGDLIDPYEMVQLVKERDIPVLFTDLLPAIPMQDRKRKLQMISRFAHIYQYSLTPHSARITWENLAHVDDWDDAFTSAIKSVLRHAYHPKRGKRTSKLAEHA